MDHIVSKELPCLKTRLHRLFHGISRRFPGFNIQLYPREYPKLYFHTTGPFVDCSTIPVLALPHVSDGRHTMYLNLLNLQLYYILCVIQCQTIWRRDGDLNPEAELIDRQISNLLQYHYGTSPIILSCCFSY